MRISEHYGLNLNQPSLDFVDVKIDTDTPLFIDPTALNLLDTEWGAHCRSLIQDYFSLVLKSIREGNHVDARRLLSVLNEPNETRLGYSSDKPRGHGMGKTLARKMWEALKDSTAVRTGIVHDLEDTALMIDGVASDVISDIVTNILRGPLLEYTQAMCKEYGIPVQDGIASKPIWNQQKRKWETMHVSQPVVKGERLLLVPKSLIRKSITFQADNYYNLYLLERLQEEEARKGLVQLLKNGRAKPPTKKSLKEKYGDAGKEQNRKYTPGREDVLEKYRKDKQENPKPALSHEKIADITHTPAPDWGKLLGVLESIKSGKKDATRYEHAIKELFAVIFYPWLVHPKSQERIHNGRKIVDITYMNMAQDDFFFWLANNYSAPYVMVECKNYSVDLRNPELDQLSGRFSPRRGKFGILVCRKIENKALFAQRCRDTADDERGYIIGIDDDDIKSLVNAIRTSEAGERLDMLRDMFKRLVM